MKAAEPLWRQWMRRDEALDPRYSRRHGTHPWYLVIWLTGVDYFSTLGYQPGIALLAAGAISPIATAVLVAVTLLCALPIYAQVAGRSYAGLGSIALLENLLPGWWGKFMVLVLLGFASTDFVITMTLSASDAALHATQNPYLHSWLGQANVGVTLVLLALLAAVFLKGFTEAIEMATAVCIPYLLLNLAVLGRALIEIGAHPDVLPRWQDTLKARGDWQQLGLAAAILFPRLALGLSGFETGVSVMPLIRGAEADATADQPQGRIRNTRKMLATAALIMSVLLLLSSFVSVLLIPKEAWQEGGPASGRAIAWMAHRYLGNVFGSVYDVSTILVLWFAGASAMAGLLHLVPRYLPRVGLAPEWVAYARPLVLVLFGFNVVVTLIFRANVEAQGGAYATGVLVLMLSAAVAATITLWKEHRYSLGIYSGGVVLVFGYTTLANVIERTDGIIIAGFFILFILTVSGVSRYWRAKELRVGGIHFADAESERLWNTIVGRKVNMVPVESLDANERADRAAKLRKYYQVDGVLAFVHIRLLDNRSEFLSPLEITVSQEDGQYLVEASQAVATANAVAYLSELLHPAAIYLGLSRQNLMRQSFRYFLLGEGETGLMVYTILQHLWEVTAAETERPCLFLMSD
jgi:preprotein translocase subunit SecG